MAISISRTALAHKEVYHISVTADADVDIALPDKALAHMSFQSDGVDGGGTLTLLVSNDGTNFVTAGFSTSADPRNLTMVTSATASGAWVVPAELLGFRFFRFHLTGSTTPTLVLDVAVDYYQ